jgi:hypothetical protein
MTGWFFRSFRSPVFGVHYWPMYLVHYHIFWAHDTVKPSIAKQHGKRFKDVQVNYDTIFSMFWLLWLFCFPYLMGAVALLFPCPHDSVIYHRSLLCYVCVLLSWDSLYDISCPDFLCLIYHSRLAFAVVLLFSCWALSGFLFCMHLLGCFIGTLNYKLLSPSEVKLSVRCSHIVWSHFVMIFFIDTSMVIFGTHVKVAYSRTNSALSIRCFYIIKWLTLISRIKCLLFKTRQKTYSLTTCTRVHY